MCSVPKASCDPESTALGPLDKIFRLGSCLEEDILIIV